MVAIDFSTVIPRIRTIVLIALAYFGTAAIALQLTRFDGGIAIVWFAGALLFSALSAMPRRLWWAIILACLPAGAGAIACFGMGNAAAAATLPLTLIGLAEAWGAAWLMKRLCPRFGRFQSLGEALCFLAVTGLLVPALSAMPGGWCAHVVRGMPFAQAWRDWFTAHALGMVTFSPPLLLAMRGKAGSWMARVGGKQVAQTTALLGAVALTCAFTFGQDGLPVAILPLVPMTAATIYLGRLGAVASVVILMVTGLAGSLAGHGPTALIHGSMAMKLEVVQLYFASAVLVLLPLAAELESRRCLMRQMRAAEALHRLIIERTSDVMMRLGPDGTVRYASPAAERVLGHRAQDLVGRSAYTLLFPPDMQIVVDARQRALSHPSTTVTVEYRIQRPDGELVWMESHMCAALDQTGRVNGTVTILRDITERRQMMDDLSLKAMTDPLTGLSNRRSFDKALAQSVEAPASDLPRGCLALFDLDHFKRINDLHGHATGDRMLVLFTAVLRGTVRGGDMIARLGGEEFAVLLEGATLEQARLVCERIRVRLAASEGRSTTGEVVRVTVSVGLASLPAGCTQDEAMRAADAALYRAKNAGRNRLTVAA
jgi:diguanylate cyclase (GGDEF)-like protein/PAS domain S-box-containing protein